MICSIIGGGLSVKNAQGFIGYRIGINHTWKYIDVDCTYHQDKPEEEIPNLHTLIHHNVPAFKKWKNEGIDFQRGNDSILMSNNSVIGGINLALQLGFKTIYVLGADNKITYPSHFYAHRFPSSRQRDQYEVLFRKVYQKLGKVTLLDDERLIFVESTIDHFENITMDEYNKLVK